MSKPITYGSDCTGLDAPYCALESLGLNVRHKFASDNDKYAKDMFLCNFTTEKFFDDACIPGKEKPYVDIYCAGFPCQSFSIAGKRGGFNDIRGTVFFYCADYINTQRPKVFLLENVKGLLSHDNGETFRVIIDILDTVIGGYTLYWDILSPDTHANWPQHRPRVFIIGVRKDLQITYNLPREIPLNIKGSDLLDLGITTQTQLTPFEQKNLDYKINKHMKKGIDIMDDFFFIDVGTSAHFGSAIHEKSPAMKASRSNYFITKLNRKLTTDEIRKFQGLPTMNLCVSESQYRKQLGNSICVPVLVRLFEPLFV